MAEVTREMLEELMGRDRNQLPSEGPGEINWRDPGFCCPYMVAFCPHDIFLNTGMDCGPCPRSHNAATIRLYHQEATAFEKCLYEDSFVQLCERFLCKADRKIALGRLRIFQFYRENEKKLIDFNSRIKKLLKKAEEAGKCGAANEAKYLTRQSEKLRVDRAAFLAKHKNYYGNIPWPKKQWKLCSDCGAIAKRNRINEHRNGKQHLGIIKLRITVQQINERRWKEFERVILYPYNSNRYNGEREYTLVDDFFAQTQPQQQ